MWAKLIFNMSSSFTSIHYLSAILSNVCARIHGVEMQREVEEELEVEDFVTALSVELSLPYSSLVTKSLSSLSPSSTPSPPS